MEPIQPRPESTTTDPVPLQTSDTNSNYASNGAHVLSNESSNYPSNHPSNQNQSGAETENGLNSGLNGVTGGEGANGLPPVSEVPRFIAPAHGGVDILKMLTELEDQIDHTRKGPFGTLLGFDEDRFHMTIMKIRANLPEEMKRASKLVREHERIVEETLTTAERIKQGALRSAQIEQERASGEIARLREQTRLETEALRAEAANVLAAAHAAAERESAYILESAQARCRDILEEARAQAAYLVSDSEILQQAQVVAQDIEQRTAEQAQAVRRGADDYARDVLANLEGVLDKATLQIQRGRELLERER